MLANITFIARTKHTCQDKGYQLLGSPEVQPDSGVENSERMILVDLGHEASLVRIYCTGIWVGSTNVTRSTILGLEYDLDLE